MLKKGVAAHRVVFLRHGQSTWNKTNQFTGWEDVDLTEKGEQEAKKAGDVLRAEGFQFDVAHTSVLTRAIKTFYNVSRQLNQCWIPLKKHWRLNERHYGALQGLNKAECTMEHGEAQVKLWRRSYDIPPPPLDLDDSRHPRFHRRYRLLPPDCLPQSESLQMTLARVLPYWYDNICVDVLAGKQVIVVAHGNSLRAVVKLLSGMNEAEITGYNIPTGVPFIYEFDEYLQPMTELPTYLMDEKELKKKMKQVANQAKGA